MGRGPGRTGGLGRAVAARAARRRGSGTRRRDAVPVAIVCVSLGVLASACGGSPSAPVANLKRSSTTTTVAPAGTGLPSASVLFADALRYATCMRAHGIADFPDPTNGPSGMPSFSLKGGPGSDLAPGSSQFQAAQSACKHDLPNPLATPAERAAANTKALAYSRCMRAHGEPSFPDPNGQGVISVTGATGALDPGSPQFARAQSACRSLSGDFEIRMSVRAHAPGGAGPATT